MSNRSGNKGKVGIGSNVIAEVLDFSLSEGINVIETTIIGDTADTHTTGTTNWSGSINCFWDDTDNAGQEAMTIGASVTLNLLPVGDWVTGGEDEINFTGTATITSIERSVANNGIITAAFSFQGNGVLTRTVLSATVLA